MGINNDLNGVNVALLQFANQQSKISQELLATSIAKLATNKSLFIDQPRVYPLESVDTYA